MPTSNITVPRKGFRPQAPGAVYDLIKHYEQAVDLLLAVVQKNR
jgi:hypothetical protein